MPPPGRPDKLTYKPMQALRADTYRLHGRYSRGLLLRSFLFNRPFRVVATLRLCQAADQASTLTRKLLLPAARVLHGIAGQLAGIEMPWRTAVAPGLALTHGRGIVVNVHARIGSNVTMFHGVTLGQRDRIGSNGERETAYPVIEDDVWIGPYAIIVGGVRVGRGSRIAGGACVFEDVPAQSIVVGNPGKVVKEGCSPDVSHRVTLPATAHR